VDGDTPLRLSVGLLKVFSLLLRKRAFDGIDCSGDYSIATKE